MSALGGNRWYIVYISLLAEALPALVSGVTLVIVMLIGFSVMAGVVGGGGLGDLAIRYGYQRFDNTLMAGTVIMLLFLVLAIQKTGDIVVRSLAHRR